MLNSFTWKKKREKERENWRIRAWGVTSSGRLKGPDFPGTGPCILFTGAEGHPTRRGDLCTPHWLDPLHNLEPGQGRATALLWMADFLQITSRMEGRPGEREEDYLTGCEAGPPVHPEPTRGSTSAVFASVEDERRPCTWTSPGNAHVEKEASGAGGRDDGEADHGSSSQTPSDRGD